ncbi:MAG: cellulase family glycosylhydrolase [Blautia sp.]|nr:cellulase family glycosylhydrolase [Blautia sp.]
MREWKGYKKGVNLGGWLSQCPHTEERYTEFIKEEDFAVIRDWGVDHVRVPIDYELVDGPEETLIESGCRHIEDAITWCRKYGLNMILDLHKTKGFSFDVGESEAGFFESEAYQEHFYRLWENLAQRFGKHEDMLAFELLNEVTDRAYCEEWNRISTECIRHIRAKTPTIRILVGGYHNNSVEAVKDLALPFDENIVYNFHCYEPLIFTHQGAYWIPGMDTSFRIPINASYGTMKQKTEELIKMKSAGFDDLPDEEALTGAYFEKIFAEAVHVAEERNVPLYCGEYGVIDLADPAETVSWYRLIHAAFEKYGIGRAAWSYKEMDFGLADPRLDEVRAEILTCL